MIWKYTDWYKYIYKRLKSTRHSKFCLLSLCLIILQSSYSISCWIVDEFVLLGAFVVPVIIVVTFNIVVTVRVMRSLKKQGEFGIQMTRKRTHVLFSLSFIFGLTWILGAATFFDYGRITKSSGPSCFVLKVFHYLFAIANSFQGCTLFLFHVLFNKTTRSQIAERFCFKKKPTSKQYQYSRRRLPVQGFRVFSSRKLLAGLENDSSTLETSLHNFSTFTSNYLGSSDSKTENEEADADKRILEEVDMEMFSPASF